MDMERHDNSALNGYTSGNELVVAIETERRRLASVLEEEVIEGLTLLVEKAAKFEKLNQHNDDAQMTAAGTSTVTSLPFSSFSVRTRAA